MSRAINLTKNKSVIVDDEDFEILNKYKWYACSGSKNTFYAARSIFIANKNNKAYMHRIILNANINDCVDHINGDGLDNRKINLRICSKAQNVMNRKKKENTFSKYKGVAKYRSKNLQIRSKNKHYRAYITFNYKRHSLGAFETEIEAAKAYDTEAKKYFGVHAKLNFTE